jgi:hypothetical protein
MPYKITSSTGKQQFPPMLKQLLDEIETDVWVMHACKPESKTSRDDVVRETVQLLGRYVNQRLIVNGIAICDASVNHEKIWAAGECYMMVAINITHTMSVVVRYYLKSPDHDQYFVLPLPFNPFTALLEEHAQAKKILAEDQALVDELWARVRAECPHTHMMAKGDHIPGGYLDKGYSHYWDECSVCGYKDNERRVEGHYG